MGFFNFLGGVERQLNLFDNGATYKNPQGNGQSQSVIQQVKNAGVGLAKTTAAPFEFLAKADLINPVRELTQGRQNVVRQSNTDLGLGPSGTNLAGGLEKVGGSAIQAGATLLGGKAASVIGEKVAPSIFSFLAPNAAANAVGSAVAKTALGVGGDLLPAGTNTAIKVIAGPLTGAAVGAPFNVGAYTASGQPITAAGELHAGVQGAATGAALGAAGEALPLAAKGVVKGVQAIDDKAIRDSQNNPAGQIGSINNQLSAKTLNALAKADNPKDVMKALDGVVSPDIAQRIAPALVKTKDPGTIDNIITEAVNPGSNAHPEPTPLPEPSPELAQANAEAAQPPEPPSKSTATAETPPNERGYTTSQKAADQYSPELKAAIGGGYRVAGDEEAISKANDLIDKQGVDETHQQVLEKLQSGQRITKQDQITAGTVVSHLDSQGRVAEAEQLHQLQAEAGTEGGQASQALGALLRRSPEGIVYSAKNQIKRAGGKVTPEVQDTLDNFKENIKETAPGSPEREEGVNQLKEFVNKQIPASAANKVFAVWRAGLLTGPQTVTKIITSHGVNTGLENLKDVPGAAVDRFISLFTGQRSLVASTRGAGEGFRQGLSAGKQLLKTGRDINPGSNAEELFKSINFGNKVPGRIAQAYVDFVGHVHGSLYKPFYGAAQRQSLYNQGLAAAKTAGLDGAEKENFVENFVRDPSSEALGVAKKDAENATFQQETELGKVASKIQKTTLGKFIVPFTRIPSAIATDLMNYSPVGLAKTVMDGIKAAKSEEGLTLATQRQLSQGIGRGLTGSAVILPGILLYNKGIMTLDYPTDPKEQKLWQLEGKIPNAIKMGGQWRSLGSIGPAGSVLAVGGHIAKSLTEGNDLGSALISGLSGGARSIEAQSYVQGISGALDALNDPQRNAKKYINSEAGSVIPTISNTVAAATDKYTRQVDTPLQAIENRIPGVRETLAPKVNVLGQPIQTPETGIEKLVDPFQSSTARTSPVINELQRLQTAGQGILPSTINKKIVFSGVNTQLTPEQQQELTKSTGQATLDQWIKIISSPGYQSASDQQKSAELKSAYRAVATHQKLAFAKQNKVGRYSPNYANNRKSAKSNKKFVAPGGGK